MVEVFSRRTGASTTTYMKLIGDVGAIDITRGPDADEMGEKTAEDENVADDQVDLRGKGAIAQEDGKTGNIILAPCDLYAGCAPEKPPEEGKKYHTYKEEEGRVLISWWLSEGAIEEV